MAPLDINISVTPILKEWIVSYYGSSKIKCLPKSFLSSKIKYLLELIPKDYKPTTIKPDCFITISLSNFAVGDPKAETYKKISTYRNFLHPNIERLIEDEFDKQFKDVFHSFMAGYVISASNFIGCQKEGIEAFCKAYNLNLNDINYEMLKKSWYRSEEKKRMETFFKK